MSLLRRRMMMQSMEEGEEMEREWKLLADITVEEDSKKIEVFQGQELEELYIYTNATNIESQGTSSEMTIKINNIETCFIGTSSPMKITCGKYGENGRNWLHMISLNPLVVQHGSWVATNTSSGKNVNCWQTNLHDSQNPYALNEKIASLEIRSANSTSTFAAGSRFIIYGR